MIFAVDKTRTSQDLHVATEHNWHNVVSEEAPILAKSVCKHYVLAFTVFIHEEYILKHAICERACARAWDVCVPAAIKTLMHLRAIEVALINDVVGG